MHGQSGRVDLCAYSLTLSMRNEMRTCARHSPRSSPRSPVETTSTALMLRSVRRASPSACCTASSELSVELPTSSMIFVTAMVRTYRTMGTVHRRRSERSWDGVAAQAYDDPALAGVEKHELIGPADGAPHYRVRYFHVPAGGRTPPERPPHHHRGGVQRGRARGTPRGHVHEGGAGDV